jgi:LmbE family N-acetylglucosaminyl deacetylase
VRGPCWLGRSPTLRRRLVVIAPHPDDETFAAAGLMRWATSLDVTVEIVALTDGEKSHADSNVVTASQLVHRRAAERGAALATLDLSTITIHRLGVPDASVSDHTGTVASLIEALADPDAVIASPPPDDGHPDHDAAGRVALEVATMTGAGCWFTPIWSRVHGVGSAPTAQLDLRDVHRMKWDAAACFASQLVALGPRIEDGPVVHPTEAMALLTPIEQIIEAIP